MCLTDVFENRARVMRSVPFVMRGAFRAALRVGLEEIAQGVEVQSEIRAVRAWKLLLLLPRMLFFVLHAQDWFPASSWGTSEKVPKPDVGFRCWTKVPCVVKEVAPCQSWPGDAVRQTR